MSEHLMTEGSISGKLISFAIPVFIGHFFQQMYNTVDALIVGNLISDLRATLKEIGKEDLLIRRSGMLAIRADQIECDYYRMLSGNPEAVNAYHGEYMSQYSWAEMTSGRLWFEYRQ